MLPVFPNNSLRESTELKNKEIGLKLVTGNCQPTPTAILSRPKRRHIARPRHPRRRLVAATETDDGCRLSEALVKQLTGGDQLRARRMREDFWGFTPSHTVILTTNHKPTIRGTDNGIWRRIRLVPFTVTIPDAEQDGDLKEKLKSEWPAILRWIVGGCVEWQREGLQPPDEVLAATASYRADMDVLGEFLKESCNVGDGYQARAGELYAVYSHWAEARGEFVESQTKFGLRLADRDYEKGRDQTNRVIYKGLGLRESGPEGWEGSDPF